MALYRTVNLVNNKVCYVEAANKSQARSHVARKIVQVEVASPNQMVADSQGNVELTPEKAGVE